MKLYILKDAGTWAMDLANECARHGMEPLLVRGKGDLIGAEAGDIFFARIAQSQAARKDDMKIVEFAQEIGMQIYPDMALIREYEDKAKQAAAYAEDWMPKTEVYTDPASATSAITKFGFPFVSKSKTGSASMNVRMINNKAEAENEIGAAFGHGLKAPHGLGEIVQRGYLIWQKFCSGNDYDYRACIVGEHVMLLRRYNRKNVPFASGSGLTEAVEQLDEETRDVLDFAFRFFRWAGQEWSGIDVVFDPDENEWRLLETTVGWKQSAYSECVFFDTEGKDSGYRGRDIWRLFCDYLKKKHA
jgi:glutathione synthase/RimK-type ligase-like ATP-grasp enzyme